MLGILQSVFALQMVLSRTRPGSLPSAMTILSLPIATPSGQCFAAAARSPSKGTTCMACISFSSKQGPKKCWVTFRLRPVAGALLQLDIVQTCITQVVRALLPLLAGWELTENSSGNILF